MLRKKEAEEKALADDEAKAAAKFKEDAESELNPTSNIIDSPATPVGRKPGYLKPYEELTKRTQQNRVNDFVGKILLDGEKKYGSS